MDPEFFYWNRQRGRDLTEFQNERDDILNLLKGVTCKRQVFLRTRTKTTDGKGVEFINEETKPSLDLYVDITRQFQPTKTWLYRISQALLYTMLISAGLAWKNLDKAYKLFRSIVVFGLV
jgi:hypothetical protein